jgi:hypothetical protein
MAYQTSLLPAYVDTVVLPTTEYYRSASNMLDIFSKYIDALDSSIAFETKKCDPKAIQATAELYKQLNDERFELFDNNFKNHFIEKFNSLSSALQQSIQTIIGSSNQYFTEYSDDIGLLTEHTTVFDNSLSPFFDIFSEESPVVMNTPVTLFNKTTNHNKLLQVKMSLHLDALMKQNLQGINGSVTKTDSTTSHGKNHVVDYQYYERLFDFKDETKKGLISALKEMGEFIFYIKNVNIRENENVAKLIPVTLDVEGITTQVDMFLNKIESGAPTMNDSLSAVR